jgi:hypothetical protein
MADNVPDKLRLNPRKSSYDNLVSVTASGDDEVTFRLKQPQPAFPIPLAGGFSAIYPCHVTATQMRQHPIGTGKRPADHLLQSQRDLSESLREGRHGHGQQHLQWLAHGRRLAGQIAINRVSTQALGTAPHRLS